MVCSETTKSPSSRSTRPATGRPRARPRFSSSRQRDQHLVGPLRVPTRCLVALPRTALIGRVTARLVGFHAVRPRDVTPPNSINGRGRLTPGFSHVLHPTARAAPLLPRQISHRFVADDDESLAICLAR